MMVLTYYAFFFRVPAPNSVFTMDQLEETGPSGEAQRLQDDVVVDFRNILQKAKSVRRKKVQEEKTVSNP